MDSVALRWIQALRSVSDVLVLVFDQDDLSAPAGYTVNVFALARHHRAYDFGSYRLGLLMISGWLTRLMCCCAMTVLLDIF